MECEECKIEAGKTKQKKSLGKDKKIESYRHLASKYLQ